MCLCGNVSRITREDLTYLHCHDCGIDWDFTSVSREQARINHRQTMLRIRENVVHTCDGPLTLFVHVNRVLEMVHAHEITAEDGANYLSETQLLYTETDYAPSTET